MKRALERSPQRELCGKSGIERKPAKRAEEFRNSLVSGGYAEPRITEREGAQRLSASERGHDHKERSRFNSQEGQLQSRLESVSLLNIEEPEIADVSLQALNVPVHLGWCNLPTP